MDNNYNIDYLYYIKNNITNYFIDNEITINDDDIISIKVKKFLLKYKRIISLICLIILLIIGYHCDFYHIINNDYNNNSDDNQIQNGGVLDPAKEARKAELAGIAAKGKADRKAAKDTAIAEKATAKKAKQDAKAAGPGKIEKKAASGQAKLAAQGQSLKNAGKKALTLSTYTDPLKNAGRAVTDNADLIFQVFYSIAIFILICIVTIPTIAFVVVGIICYVLLKPKMAALKAL